MLLEKLITRPWRLLLPLVASCLLATGCTSTRFGYEALPLWLSWQIDRHLGLDASQREFVSARIDALERWHRQTQLPAYGALVASVQARLQHPVGQEDIGRWREQLLGVWDPIADRLAPDAAALALTLKPAQLERLAQRFEESNREARRKMLPADPRRREQARVERVLERINYFVGDLPTGLEREIRAQAAALPATEPEWLAEREARQRAILAVLERIVRERPPPETAQAWCRETLRAMWRSADPARREALEHSARAGDALSLQVLMRAGPPQREHLFGRLRGLVDDFSVLSRR